MEKKGRSLYELEELHDYQCRQLKYKIESGASTEELMRAAEDVEKQRERIRVLERAESFRRSLGLVFIVIAVAFTRAIAHNRNFASGDWFVSFLFELFITAIIVLPAYICAHVVTSKNRFSHSFIDYLPDCGCLFLVLALIYTLS